MSTKGRPDPPFYVGRTHPGGVGWGRVLVTLGLALLLSAVTVFGPGGVPLLLLAPVVTLFVLYAGWTWIRLDTRFIVDERGVTVSLGGFWPQASWPVADFRRVQLREIPSDTLGVTVGALGWRRRGRVISSTRENLTPLPGNKVFTNGNTHDQYRLLVTRPGTMVEIIGRRDVHYLLSPEDPQGTAEAIDQAIRARR